MAGDTITTADLFEFKTTRDIKVTDTAEVIEGDFLSTGLTPSFMHEIASHPENKHN